LAASGLLWVAVVFTALLGLGRAFVPEREQSLFDGLILATPDRSAIWLAKSLATLAFLGVAEAVALPLFALFFHGIDGSTVAAFALADVGVGASVAADPGRYLLFLLLYDALFAVLCWAAFEYVVTE